MGAATAVALWPCPAQIMPGSVARFEWTLSNVCILYPLPLSLLTSEDHFCLSADVNRLLSLKINERARRRGSPCLQMPHMM